ncbi:hypothetical protein Srot_2951 [Segniliparus rotundus DSM 44985]|uniref:DUF7683 domain-containing protein n=1 Tax=Segniliparus rotundus (strain ATCC BAA-972 / CDC 1076 / CIP 108378 / DSM 44985 / JCM 13578) TaxID=640132 RepID=D6ZDX3_SEGRD|nr:hypothetical protein [Segniliparus rotundus]ADG99380.1 hypothetical protein Srot_2951 [Segniliparus rotundus DSM 44985]
MWYLEAFDKTTESLAYEFALPSITDETVRRILGLPEDDPDIYYGYDIPNKTALEELASYIDGEFEFDDSVDYQITFYTE